MTVMSMSRSTLSAGSPPSTYDCNEQFPRLTRDQLPAGVVECTYQVSIGAIEPFRIKDWKRR